MLSREQNDLLTQTGPGTPGGRMMRSYWVPVALAEELRPHGAPLPVRLFSEDLVLFRDAAGKPGLADYPCVEAGRLILAFLGAGTPPPLPAIPFLHAPGDRVWCTKLWTDCNYLQASEGNVDPQHVSFLHRIDLREISREGARIIATDGAPNLDIEETDFGFRIYTKRVADAEHVYVRVTNFIMPSCSSFVGAPRVDPQVLAPDENDGCQHHWHVPVDDEHHWKYLIAYRESGPVDPEYLSRRIVEDTDGKYHLHRNAGNRYGQDRTEMTRRTFTGMGTDFQAHDRFATESQSPISDRTREHLGVTDRGVILMRRQLLEAIDDVEAGREPLLRRQRGGRDPLADMVVRAAKLPRDADVHGFWRTRVATP
jgi:phthalate 4,5-dioxygenase